MVIRLVQGQGLERDWVAWEAISPHLRQAVVAAEDNLFCEHSGFDWRSLEEAAKAYAAGQRPAGGSTLTMPTAPNLLLWPSRSIVRQGLHAPRTAGLALLCRTRRPLAATLT